MAMWAANSSPRFFALVVVITPLVSCLQWIKKLKQPEQMPDPPMLTQAQAQAYFPPFPKSAQGRGGIRVSSLPQTVEQMVSMVRHFDPKSGVRQPKQFGRLDGFKPITVPIVFHRECLQWQSSCCLALVPV